MTEEYFDVVNENSEAIGQEVRRNSGLRRRGMHVFLFTPDRVEKLPVRMSCSTPVTLRHGLLNASKHMALQFNSFGKEHSDVARTITPNTQSR